MIEVFNAYFHPAGEDRRIFVWLPDDYYSSNERYPVMYMMDGHNLFYDRDATFGMAMQMHDFFRSWDKKMIMIGIDCANNEWDRIEEYCPFDMWTSIYGNTRGRAADTMDWIVHELKPMVDNRFRTWPHREATGIGGSSLGGLLATFAVLRYNRYFSKAACLSPTLTPSDFHFRAEVRNQVFFPDTRIFFSWGTTEDSPEEIAHLTELVFDLEHEVQKQGCKTYHLIQNGGQHNEIFWRQQTWTFMNFLWH